MAVCLQRYRHVRHKALLTDDGVAQQRFYDSVGDVSSASSTAASRNASVRFDA